MGTSFQAVRGMNDLLPAQAARYRRLVECVSGVLARYEEAVGARLPRG